MDINVLAAVAAAAVAFGTTEEDSTTLPRFDNSFITAESPAKDAALAAGRFVRANPDAPAESIPIELRLKGVRGVPQGGFRVMAAWRVFAFTLKELDRVDAEAAREQAAAHAAAQNPQRPRAHADELAMMPQARAFDPRSGLRPGR